jgi:hypothetical protein
MPYKLGKHTSCPASKPHAVLKEDGSLVPGGCHESRSKALKHQRALQVNVEDASLNAQIVAAEVVEAQRPDPLARWRD